MTMPEVGGMAGLDGEPIDYWQYAELLGSEEACVGVDNLAHPETGDLWRVCTAWVGALVALGHDDPPRPFETLVYGPASTDTRMLGKYTTWDEAREGHARACWAVFRHLAEGHNPDDQHADDGMHQIEALLIVARLVQEGVPALLGPDDDEEEENTLGDEKDDDGNYE